MNAVWKLYTSTICASTTSTIPCVRDVILLHPPPSLVWEETLLHLSLECKSTNLQTISIIFAHACECAIPNDDPKGIAGVESWGELSVHWRYLLPLTNLGSIHHIYLAFLWLQRLVFIVIQVAIAFQYKPSPLPTFNWLSCITDYYYLA